MKKLIFSDFLEPNVGISLFLISLWCWDCGLACWYLQRRDHHWPCQFKSSSRSFGPRDDGDFEEVACGIVFKKWAGRQNVGMLLRFAARPNFPTHHHLRTIRRLEKQDHAIDKVCQSKQRGGPWRSYWSSSWQTERNTDGACSQVTDQKLWRVLLNSQNYHGTGKRIKCTPLSLLFHTFASLLLEPKVQHLQLCFFIKHTKCHLNVHDLSVQKSPWQTSSILEEQAASNHETNGLLPDTVTAILAFKAAVSTTKPSGKRIQFVRCLRKFFRF